MNPTTNTTFFGGTIESVNTDKENGIVTVLGTPASLPGGVAGNLTTVITGSAIGGFFATPNNLTVNTWFGAYTFAGSSQHIESLVKALSSIVGQTTRTTAGAGV